VRSDLRVVALAFAADSPTLQSPVDERKRKAATPKLAAANAASKKCIVSEDEDNAPEVKPKKKPTAAPKPAAPVKPTAAAPKPAAPVKPTAAAPKPAAAPKKQAAPKARAPRATASKIKKHVVSDDEDENMSSDAESDFEDAAPKKKAAAPKPAAPKPAVAKAASKKRIVSDDEDEDVSVEEESDFEDDEDDSDDDVSSHTHGSPSCRVSIPML
jgi:hypothetical protein